MAYNRWLSAKNELYHHGVKGQKWGVRRDRRRAGKYIRGIKKDLTLLNEREYNTTKKAIKYDAKAGKISYYDRDAKLANAKLKYDKKRGEIKNLKQTKSVEETRKDYEKIREKAMSEIPNYKLKSGIKTANKIITGLAVGSLAISAGAYGAGVAIVAGSYGGAAAAAYGVSAATNLGASGAYTAGYHYLRKGIASSLT